jgi:hypothetical protein
LYKIILLDVIKNKKIFNKILIKNKIIYIQLFLFYHLFIFIIYLVNLLDLISKSFIQFIILSIFIQSVKIIIIQISVNN